MDKKIYIWIFAFILIISVIHGLHSYTYGVGLMGDDSFHYANSAMRIQGDEQPTLSQWYEGILAYKGKLIGIEASSFFLLFFCGLLSVLLFILILNSIEGEKTVRHYSLLFLLASPLFIYNITVSQPFTVVSVLVLATVYFLVSEWQKPYLGFLSYMSIFFSALIALIEPLAFVIFILPFLFYLLIKKKNNRVVFLTATVSLVGFLFRIKTIEIGEGIVSLQGFFENNIVMLGAMKGFIFISILLAILAFFVTWHKKREKIPIYAMVVMAILGSVYADEGYKIILNFFIAYCAAYGFFWMMGMRWDLKIIKKILYLTLIAGVMFSGFFYVNSLFSKSPGEETIRALHIIRGNSLETEVVFSDNEKKEWIMYFAERDFCCEFANEEIFTTRNNNFASEFMKKHNISFILVDDNTRELMKRENNNIGLEFVMENSNNFKKIASYDSTVVWAFQE